MSDKILENTITLLLKDGQQIKFINANTGTESVRVISGGSISLSKGIVYKLPINEIDLDLADHYVVKESQSLSAKMLIRGVSDGMVTIYPIVNGVSLLDGQFVGNLI